MSKTLRIAVAAITMATLSGCGDAQPTPGFDCRQGVDYLAQERQFQICVMSRPENAERTWIDGCQRAAAKISQRRVCMPIPPLLRPIDKAPQIKGKKST